MADECTFIFPQELYKTTLSQIEGIQFTQREVDIIACLICARRPSAIASLLSISPNTVATHLRNIMLKIGCNSQNAIITFIERSDKCSDLRRYYNCLCLLNEFKRTLKDISRKALKAKPKDIQLQVEDDGLKASFKIYLPEHLRILNSKFKVKEKQGVFSIHQPDVEDSAPGTEHYSINPDMYYHEALLYVLSLIYPCLDFETQVRQFMEKVDEFCREASKTPNEKESDRVLEGAASVEENGKGPLHKLVKGYKLFVGGAIAVLFLIMAGLSIPFLNYEATQNEMYVAANTWNLPRILPHHTERKGLIDRINFKFSEQAHRKGALIVGLQGLGGIGKTTLAKYIVTHPQKEYSFIGWFHAETPELLESEYCNLGQKHNLFSKSAPDHLKIHLVKEWINRQDNALLVYDNVPNMEMLEDFLPHNGDIIITSRNYKIPNVIKIGAMTEEESLSLLDKLIPMDIQNQEGYAQQVRELASMLGHLPLALSQAGYYIHENNLTVGGFLSLYEANKAKLLSEDSMPPADQHAPAYVTWDMSLQKIRETPGGSEALKVLKFISYCYPENIPMEILMQALYGDVSEELRFELNKHIKLLNQYSLIDVCPGNISIHRLVHSWAKNKDNKKEKLKGALDVIDAMEGIYPGIEERNKSTEDIQFARKMLPHAEYVVSEWGALLDSSRFLRLITNMADAYELLGSFKKSKRRFREALAMSEKKFGRYHPNTAMILFHLSWNNRVLGNLKKSNQKSKEALEILDKIDQSGSFLAADILSNYGLTELLLCHYANAKDILSRSMHIIEASYGEDDVNTTFPIRRLGIAYLYLGDYAKARKYLDKAARGMEKFFGKEHLEFVNVTSNLGVLHMLMGELQIAEDFLLAALRFKEEYYGLTHRSTAKAYYRLGNVYLFLRDYKKAESYYQRALNTLGELATDSKKNIYYNIYLAALGNIKRLSGESTEGLSLMEKSLENMHAYYTEHNTNTACVMANMGLVYGTMGEYDKSRKYLEKALAIFTDNLSSDHPYISQTRGEVQKSNDASRNNKKPLVGYVINIEA